VSTQAAVTVNRPLDEVRELWGRTEHPFIDGADASVVFRDAPGDRGTEIHVQIGSGGNLLDAVQVLLGNGVLPKVKDELRRFKQLAETGEIPRSDGTPEGELAERKLKQRPAQPLPDSELAEAGVR
jgi:uncharacterized membrane protein